jgi:hypothetical protein
MIHCEVIVPRRKDDELWIAALKRRLAKAQRRIRRYVEPGRSLADELIAERRVSVKLKTGRKDSVIK